MKQGRIVMGLLIAAYRIYLSFAIKLPEALYFINYRLHWQQRPPLEVGIYRLSGVLKVGGAFIVCVHRTHNSSSFQLLPF
jgi:hypothetical protein